MYDCRLNGGHFFVYKPQGHAFRCRRCSERFINSYTDVNLKHPWKCLIERCEYIACDPCSSILVEQLANTTGLFEDEDRMSLKSLDGKRGRESDEDEDVKGEVDRMPRRPMEGGGHRGVVREVIPELPEVQGPEIIEADDENDDSYEIPTFICRTARQAAAEAAMKRAHVKARSVRRPERATGERAG